jgi:hypothetical protein
MDHRPFEDWLVSETPLSPRQKHELAAHLKTCRACSAISEVDLALHAVRQAEPAAGFSDRFQVRLVARKQAMRRRNVYGFIILALGVLGLLAGLTWPLVRTVIAAPVDTLASWLTSLVGLWASIQALFHAGSLLFRVAPGFLPGYLWALFLFGLTGWSLVWVFSLKKFTRLPQGV